MKKILLITLILGTILTLGLIVQSQEIEEESAPGSMDRLANEYADANNGSDTGTLTDDNSAGQTPYDANLASADGDDIRSQLMGLYHSERDNRYYASSRWLLFIWAVESLSEFNVGVRKIEVAIDNNDFYEYSGRQLRPYERTINDQVYEGLRTGDFSVQNEGLHTITFRATDEVGNIERDNIVNFWIDNTPPWVEAHFDVENPGRYRVFIQDGIIYLPAAHNISLFAFDTGCGVASIEYMVQNPSAAFPQEWTEYDFVETSNEHPFIDRLQEGWNVLRVKATDHVGNVSPEVTYNIFVDVHGPVIEIWPRYAPIADEDGTLYVGVDNGYDVVAVDRESGVNETLVQVDGRGWDIYRRPIEFSTSGRHTINAKAFDNVGNMSMLENPPFTVIVDVIPPYSSMQGDNHDFYDFLNDDEEAVEDDAVEETVE